jgi:hypothetical protein
MGVLKEYTAEEVAKARSLLQYSLDVMLINTSTA